MARSSSRHLYFVLLLGAFVFISFYLYGSLDSATSQRKIETERNQDELNKLRSRVASLEKDLTHNDKLIKTVKEDLRKSELQRKELLDKQIEKENDIYDEKLQAGKDLEKKSRDDVENAARETGNQEEEGRGHAKDVGAKPQGGNKVAIVHGVLSRTSPKGVPTDICTLRGNFTGADTDVQMLDMYNIIPFDNVDGGVWKQGWELNYDLSEAKNSKNWKLLSFLIHIVTQVCFLGWILTFEGYYQERTRHILDNMVKHLDSKPDMRFIYAEMSFFERWWSEQDETTKEKVRSMLKSGQFEIVTGGWVMTDEANAHYHSIITELMEGHEFIRNHLGKDFIPHTHWSIDPFGLSPSLPLILSASNITNAALQRVHYSVKKKLAQNKQLEFMWRQMWDGSTTKRDVRSHIFPFYSYDVPHTCGPEPKVCCQFDFKRLPGGGHSCDWGVPPQQISENNVKQRAFMIYDQYRKKSQLYKSNVLLVPLGDDFRYQDDFEWNHQHDNYQKLFKYMNSNPEWNVNARFGTLSDYFNLLEKSLEEENEKLPVLSGDFFTYADRDDHYWSGYFTTRPFYKQMDRVLQHYLRSAEIAFSLARINGKEPSGTVSLFGKLVEARRSLSLFQHHDGVTGTSKDPVVIDYGQRMLAALNNCEEVIGSSIGVLSQGSTMRLNLDEFRQQQDMLPVKRVVPNGGSLILFNSLAQSREEIVCVHVPSPSSRITVDGGTTVDQQIAPFVYVKEGRLHAEPGKYELCFSSKIGPFSSVVYQMESTDSQTDELVTVKGSDKPTGLDSFFSFTLSSKDFELSSGMVTGKFSGVTGFLKSVTLQSGDDIQVDTHFVKYGARGHRRLNNGGSDDLSGAYLFLPDGEAKRMDITDPSYVVLDGPLLKRVVVAGPKDGKLTQIYAIYKDSPHIDIRNTIDLRERRENIEIAMRLETSVNSGDDVYTDLNGLQMIHRRRMLHKLPLQAHFYPMPSSAFIEDDKMRVTLFGSQALGVSSLKSGYLEVMLDRRLQQDDNRGMQQGILDNIVTVSHFRLLIEPMKNVASEGEGKKSPTAFHSLVGIRSSRELLYPVVKLISKDKLPSSSAFNGLTQSLPCDIHVVTMRTRAAPTNYEKRGSPSVEPLHEAALVLHRDIPDCRSTVEMKGECTAVSDGLDFKSLLRVKSVTSASLTLLYDHETTVDRVTVDPQDVRTVKVTF